jgi:hypothetical protein
MAQTISLIATKDLPFNKKILSGHINKKKTRIEKKLHVLQNDEKPKMFLQEN